jgi:S-adenosyl-L-methionine hydrolase (adenosine-forming)
MAILTLTSDWGLKDYYAAAVKGSILSDLPDAVIVDISHQVPAYDLIQASLILKNACRNFPEGTIHLIEVKAQADETHTHLAIFSGGHYFIGPDNGIFSLTLEEKPDSIVEIETNNRYSPFPCKEIYVKAAVHLARGGKPDVLGSPRERMVEKMMIRPAVEGSAIRGSIIYIDHMGNIITNISRNLFEQVSKGRQFNIFLRRFEYEISTIHHRYNQVPEGEKLALFNSQGYLEIAINQGKASALLGLTYNDSIRIEFHDNTNSANVF